MPTSEDNESIEVVNNIVEHINISEIETQSDQSHLKRAQRPEKLINL